MKKTVIFSSLVVFAAASAAPSDITASTPPLYQAFKTFCVDTHMDKAQIEQAVQRVGFPIKTDGAVSSPPFGTNTSWDFNLQGHHIFLVYGDRVEYFGKNQERPAKSCLVMGDGSDDQSTVKINRLMGIESTLATTKPIDFIMREGKPVILQDPTAVSSAAERGVAWRFRVDEYPPVSRAWIAEYGVPRPRTPFPPYKPTPLPPLYPERPFSSWTVQERKAGIARVLGNCVFAVSQIGDVVHLADFSKAAEDDFGRSVGLLCLAAGMPTDWSEREDTLKSAERLYGEAQSLYPELEGPERWKLYFARWFESYKKGSTPGQVEQPK